MEEIKVGEYVRLKSGLIGQFYNIEEGYDGNIEVNFEEFGYEYEDIEQFYNDIKSHSKIISEVVEVGDYVNGREVLDNDGEYITVNKLLSDGNSYRYREYSEDEIKSIVTKEQFSNIEYRLEN